MNRDSLLAENARLRELLSQLVYIAKNYQKSPLAGEALQRIEELAEEFN